MTLRQLLILCLVEGRPSAAPTYMYGKDCIKKLS